MMNNFTLRDDPPATTDATSDNGRQFSGRNLASPATVSSRQSPPRPNRPNKRSGRAAALRDQPALLGEGLEQRRNHDPLGGHLAPDFPPRHHDAAGSPGKHQEL